ncbi:uncharacterized protein LOC126838844 [Adelges cooleyi]|uniref:uncharacterized protein LOC126838844 n=1 Tax=Adelges cooleyi TaxID=133065 RepID=UPI00217F5F0F|nr:uncharacterized protein LOC126838844 [Adelges cooleyi]
MLKIVNGLCLKMTSRHYILTLFLFNLYFVSIHVMAFNPLFTYLLRFTRIDLYPNVSGTLEIDEYKGKHYMNGKILIDSPLLIDTVVGVLDRCDLEGINCEYFQTWTLDNVCPKLLQKHQVWSSWYGAFDPPMVCPLNKRNYALKNATFAVEPIVALYGEATNYHWKVKQLLYSNKILIGYYTVQFKFFGYRKKLFTKHV